MIWLDVDIITDFIRGSAVQIAWKKVPKKNSGQILLDDSTTTESDGYLECVKAIYRVKNFSCEARWHISTSPRTHKRSSSFGELKNFIDFNDENKVKVDNYSIEREILKMSKSTKATEDSVSNFWSDQIEVVLSKYLSYLKIK